MPDSDNDDLVELASITDPLREPVLRRAIRALGPPQGSWGLDAGCGPGFQTVMLAEAVGPEGHVTGLDLSTGLLVYAAKMVEQSGLADRITFRVGDANALPFEDDSFDWAWSADCVGYAPVEPLPMISELARVVKPGGRIAILAWSSEKLLPGYPDLEARLNATPAGIAPFIRGKAPEFHFNRLMGWLRAAGLESITVRTLAGEVHAPLSEDIHHALTALFQMRWAGVEPELSGEDLAAYRRLCRPASQDFIANHPDYYAFFTYSMFSGLKPV